MLRLTRTYRSRISNRMAVLAAFLLVAAAAASMDGSLDSAPNEGPAIAGTSLHDGSTPVSTVRSTKGKKGFRVSLYLFRRN